MDPEEMDMTNITTAAEKEAKKQESSQFLDRNPTNRHMI